MSNDGSRETLKEYSDRGKLKLVTARCSRGRGRQICFECSAGSYIIANLDLDDTFKPRLREALETYHERCEGTLLCAKSIDKDGFWGGGNLTIASRSLLLRLGGWHDLQIGEDWELESRAARAGAYRWTYFQLLERANSHPERKSQIGRMKFRYVRYRDLMRCGRQVFKKGDHVSPFQRIPFLFAKISLPFYESYAPSTAIAPNMSSMEYFIDFGEHFDVP